MSVLYRSLLMLVLVASSALADDLKIAGETAVQRDRLVKLSASGHDPKAGLIWRVYPKIDTANRADTSKDKLQFSAPPGTYSVELLSVKLGMDGATEVSEASVTVVIGQSPNPSPTPTPTPAPVDGALGLVKASREGLSQVPVLARGDAGKLAAWQRSLSSSIAAGAYQTPQQVLAAWRDGNNKAVNASSWSAWAAPVSAQLQALYTQGKFPTVSDWAPAFAEIASGLEGK